MTETSSTSSSSTSSSSTAEESARATPGRSDLAAYVRSGNHPSSEDKIGFWLSKLQRAPIVKSSALDNTAKPSHGLQLLFTQDHLLDSLSDALTSADDSFVLADEWVNLGTVVRPDGTTALGLQLHGQAEPVDCGDCMLSSEEWTREATVSYSLCIMPARYGAEGDGISLIPPGSSPDRRAAVLHTRRGEAIGLDTWTDEYHETEGESGRRPTSVAAEQQQHDLRLYKSAEGYQGEIPVDELEQISSLGHLPTPFSLYYGATVEQAITNGRSGASPLAVRLIARLRATYSPAPPVDPTGEASCGGETKMTRFKRMGNEQYRN